MKLTLVFAFALAGCSDFSDCGGDYQMSQALDGPAEGSCMVAQIDEGSDGFVSLDTECPSSRCVVVFPGETFRVWKDTLSSDPMYSTATLPFLPDGSCRLTCE